MKTSRVVLAAMLVFIFSGTALAATEKKDEPNGTIEVTFTGLSAGVGATLGKGVLTYKGYKIPFEASSISIGEVGIGKRKGTGFIYNLRNLRDFNSSYSARKRGLAVIAGRGYERLENDNGVVIELKSEETGLELGLAAGKTKMTLHEDVLAPVLAELNAPAKKTAANAVFFEMGSADISEAEKSKLHELIDIVRKNPATEVRITGYTDTTGTFERNVELSNERASKVSEELKRIAKQSGLNQLPPERIDVFGAGEVGGKQELAEQANRRVDVAVYSSPRSRKDINP